MPQGVVQGHAERAAKGQQAYLGAPRRRMFDGVMEMQKRLEQPALPWFSSGGLRMRHGVGGGLLW